MKKMYFIATLACLTITLLFVFVSGYPVPQFSGYSKQRSPSNDGSTSAGNQVLQSGNTTIYINGDNNTVNCPSPSTSEQNNILKDFLEILKKILDFIVAVLALFQNKK